MNLLQTQTFLEYNYDLLHDCVITKLALLERKFKTCENADLTYYELEIKRFESLLKKLNEFREA